MLPRQWNFTVSSSKLTHYAHICCIANMSFKSQINLKKNHSRINIKPMINSLVPLYIFSTQGHIGLSNLIPWKPFSRTLFCFCGVYGHNPLTSDIGLSNQIVPSESVIHYMNALKDECITQLIKAFWGRPPSCAFEQHTLSFLPQVCDPRNKATWSLWCSSSPRQSLQRKFWGTEY